ncbi:MAG: (R)-hydroxyglutaryl-CoA dehydratase activator (hgdC) [Dehalococcoidales bacterium]|nr:(R)-hydroxyglutaryl-CoA dehydratase activator (hgdC) [Dehalococcoidales bacterium]
MVGIGIDAGVQSIKVVAVDGETILASAVVPYEDEPVSQSARRALEEVSRAGGLNGPIERVALTGKYRAEVGIRGREVAPAVCLAVGIGLVEPTVHSVLDVGVETAMAVRCRAGIPMEMAVNDRCAAGTGSYMEVLSDIFETPVAALADLALRANPSVKVEMVNTCAVFSESEIISLRVHGYKPEDLLLASLKALAQRLQVLLMRITCEPDVAMVGGLARNRVIVQMLGESLGISIIVPKTPQSIMAMGAAIVAGRS